MILNARQRKKSSASSAPPIPANVPLGRLNEDELREAIEGSCDCGAAGIGVGLFVIKFETGNHCPTY